MPSVPLGRPVPAAGEEVEARMLVLMWEPRGPTLETDTDYFFACWILMALGCDFIIGQGTRATKI